MTHDQLKELVPLFALDALTSDDERELVAHLSFCRECSELLVEHRETAGMLAMAVPSRQAPGDLRDRILQQAAQTPQLHVSANPVPIKQKAPTRTWRWQWAGLAAACVLAFLVGGVVVRQVDGTSGNTTDQQLVIAQQREALEIIGSPTSVVLPMASTEDYPGAYGKAFVSDEEGKAAVVVSGLEEPGDDIYTLWLIADGDRKPVEDFVPEDGTRTILVEKPVNSDATLAVTREPKPGNTSPKGPVIMAAYRA